MRMNFPEVASVYRFQRSNGRGPYQRGLTDLWLREDPPQLEAPDPDAIRPLISQAAAICPKANFGFGCRTLEQIKLWFNEDEQMRLNSLGFFLYRVNAARIIWDGPEQVLFFTRWPLYEADKVR